MTIPNDLFMQITQIANLIWYQSYLVNWYGTITDVFPDNILFLYRANKLLFQKTGGDY